MAIINSYPTATPTGSDLIIGTDVSTTPNSTKTFTIDSINALGTGTPAAGTVNTIPIFTSAVAVGDSTITKSGSNYTVDGIKGVVVDGVKVWVENNINITSSIAGATITSVNDTGVSIVSKNNKIHGEANLLIKTDATVKIDPVGALGISTVNLVVFSHYYFENYDFRLFVEKDNGTVYEHPDSPFDIS